MRGNLANYAEWQQIVNKVLELIRGNNQLLKILCNSSNTPYEQDPPSWDKIILKNVFPMPKEPDSVDEQKSFINVYMYNSSIKDDNPYFFEDLLCVEVGSHLEIWMLENGEIRPYSIVNLIGSMINNKSIPDLSIQKVIPEITKVLKFGDMFYGYRMFFKLTNAGGINCG